MFGVAFYEHHWAVLGQSRHLLSQLWLFTLSFFFWKRHAANGGFIFNIENYTVITRYVVIKNSRKLDYFGDIYPYSLC